MCNKECSTEGSCPFSFTEESEQAQNYGCLPTPMDIVNMRVSHGKTWACHENNKIPCKGALRCMMEEGVDCRVIDKNLVTEGSGWGEYL